MIEGKRELPAIALRGMTILPGMIAHFDVSRPKSVKAVEQAMLNDQQIFLVTQRNVEEEEPGLEGLYQIGIIAIVKQVIKLPHEIVRVLVEGKERARLQQFLQQQDYLQAEVTVLQEEESEYFSQEISEAMMRSLRETLNSYMVVNPKPEKKWYDRLGKYRIYHV